jgi:hypothetical protein
MPPLHKFKCREEVFSVTKKEIVARKVGSDGLLSSPWLCRRGPLPLPAEPTVRPGPGEYVPASTERITRVEDLPAPLHTQRSRDDRRRPCPRCHGVGQAVAAAAAGTALAEPGQEPGQGACRRTRSPGARGLTVAVGTGCQRAAPRPACSGSRPRRHRHTSTCRASKAPSDPPGSSAHSEHLIARASGTRPLVSREERSVASRPMSRSRIDSSAAHLDKLSNSVIRPSRPSRSRPRATAASAMTMPCCMATLRLPENCSVRAGRARGPNSAREAMAWC